MRTRARKSEAAGDSRRLLATGPKSSTLPTGTNFFTRSRRNVFSYCLKRLVLLIMIGDFQNGGGTSRLERVKKLLNADAGECVDCAHDERACRSSSPGFD